MQQILLEVEPELSLRELALALVFAEQHGYERLYRSLLSPEPPIVLGSVQTMMGASFRIVNALLPPPTFVISELVFDSEREIFGIV